MAKPLPFNLPMKEAAKKFAEKVPLTRAEFDTLSDWAKVRAFTVATVTKAEILQDVMDAAQKAIDEGLSLADFNAVLGDVMDVRGWTGLTPWHSEAVMRTNVQMAYGSGRLEQQQAQAEDFPAWQFISNEPVDECADLNETVFSIDDVDWYPPIHFNSVLPGNIVAGDVQLASRMLYAGQAREIKSRSGLALTITRNHPVLTMRGMLPAHELNEGDYLLRDVHWGELSSPLFGSVERDDDYAPAAIEKIFDALSDAFPAFHAKHSVLDLHGDAARGHSDIEVVAVDGQLRDDFERRISRQQRGSHFALAVPDMRPASFSCSRPADERRFGVAVGVTGVHRNAVSLPLQQLPFGLSAQRDSEFTQLLAYAGARNTGLSVKFLDRLPVAVSIDQRRRYGSAHSASPSTKRAKPFLLSGVRLISPGNSRRLGSTADLDAAILEARDKCKARDARFASELQRGLAGLIAADQIVEIRDFDYVGHVYDLQTHSSIITVNGILTSNCRCHGEPLTQAEAEEIGIDDGSDLPEPLGFAGPGAGDDYEPDFDGIDSEIATDAQNSIDDFDPNDVND